MDDSPRREEEERRVKPLVGLLLFCWFIMDGGAGKVGNVNSLFDFCWGGCCRPLPVPEFRRFCTWIHGDTAGKG